MTTTKYTSQDDEFGSPIEVAEGGVRCANHPRDWKIRHENTEAVRVCYAISKQIMDELARREDDEPNADSPSLQDSGIELGSYAS